jgi:hypothetical protein
MLGVAAAQVNLLRNSFDAMIAQSQKRRESGPGEQLHNLPLRAITSDRRARTIIDDTVPLEVLDRFLSLLSILRATEAQPA